MQPLLDQGESGGRDIIVVTDWMAKQMYDLGYLQELDPDDIPTVLDEPGPAVPVRGFLRPRPQVLDPVAGRHDRALGRSRAEADDVTSVNDLFDPQVQGAR